jgi:hypothetical protein
MSDKKELSAGARTGAASKAAAAGLKKNQPAKPDKPKDTRSHEEIKNAVVKLNVPKRAKYETAQLKARFQALREENPAALVAGAAGVVALVGTGIFFGVRAATRR